MQQTLANFASSGVFHLLLINARILPIIMFTTGFGENYVSSRSKISLSIFISLLILSRVSLDIKYQTSSSIFLIVTEIIIGVTLSVVIKIIVSAAHIAGNIISNHTGLASAQMFDPALGASNTIESRLIMLIVTTLIMITNIHHILIAALFESYNYYPIGFKLSDFEYNKLFADLMNNIFAIGIKLAMPVILIILMLYTVSGVISKIMPNVQIFFIMMPLQIIIGFMILFFSLSVIGSWFIEQIPLLLNKYIF
jgi:flagellar biosynthetic protein FliR